MIKIYLVVKYTEGIKSPLLYKFILDIFAGFQRVKLITLLHQLNLLITKICVKFRTIILL